MSKAAPMTAGQKAAATKAAKKATAPASKPLPKPDAKATTKAPTKAPAKTAAKPVVATVAKAAETKATRSDVAESIRESLREEGMAVSEKIALRMVSAYEDAVATFLAHGREVLLPGFGKFRVSERPGGLRRNPSSGETIQVGPSIVASFKVGTALKKVLNE